MMWNISNSWALCHHSHFIQAAQLCCQDTSWLKTTNCIYLFGFHSRSYFATCNLLKPSIMLWWWEFVSICFSEPLLYAFFSCALTNLYESCPEILHCAREEALTSSDMWSTVNAALWLVHLNISRPVIGWGLWWPSCSPKWELWAWPDSAHIYANEVTWLMINGRIMQMSCQKYCVMPIYGRTISWRGRRLEIFMNELWPLIFF